MAAVGEKDCRKPNICGRGPRSWLCMTGMSDTYLLYISCTCPGHVRHMLYNMAAISGLSELFMECSGRGTNGVR